MKPLQKMTFPERAAVLHQLFSDEIPAMLQFISDMAQTMPEEEAHNREKFHSQHMTFDEWLALARRIHGIINRYGKRLSVSSRLFADQLFDGNNAAFCIYCFKVYCMVKKPVNPKFNQAIQLLFI